MPTKTWEPPPLQSDSDTGTHQRGKAEPRNFEPARGGHGRNPDAPVAEPVPLDYDYDDEDINTNGSER